MRATRQIWVSGAVGVCLLGIGLRRWAQIQPVGSWDSIAFSRTSPRLHLTPADLALQDARRWRLRAMMRVNAEREAIQEWDPRMEDTRVPYSAALEPWRLEQMAMDRGGHLRRARKAALRAATLARRHDEKHRASEHLARIEHELGHHEAELQQAQRLMELAPRDPISLTLMGRAAACNGRTDLAQRTEAALAALNAIRNRVRPPLTHYP
jgi:hypothetical protein